MARETEIQNLITALKLGVIDWFQFFELWRLSMDRLSDCAQSKIDT